MYPDKRNASFNSSKYIHQRLRKNFALPTAEPTSCTNDPLSLIQYYPKHKVHRSFHNRIARKHRKIKRPPASNHHVILEKSLFLSSRSRRKNVEKRDGVYNCLLSITTTRKKPNERHHGQTSVSLAWRWASEAVLYICVMLLLLLLETNAFRGGDKPSRASPRRRTSVCWR